MNFFQPILFSDLKSYSKKQLLNDIIAGIIVAIIALPLSIALAIASGVGPKAGIFTAICAGLVTSFFGGSSVQISGPTAAFATIVAGIVAKNGINGLALATVIAGIMLIIMGAFKFGNLIKYIPYTITTGFTAGIAVTLVIGQLKDFTGVTYLNGQAPIETIEKLEAFISSLSTFNFQALIVGLVSLIVLVVWPKIYDKIPASLVAVAVGIIMVKGFNMNANTIGDLYSVERGLPTFAMPAFSFSAIKQILPDAFTIALLAGIESLLSCVVADGMTNKQHRSNTELTAQGLGNICSALFGGIPSTGAIARTAANIKNGGRTPISGIVHALVLLLVVVLLMPYAALIPMPTIAAILISVAYNMCQWRQFVHLTKTSPKGDIIVLFLTFVLTVVFDLVVAIEIGLLVACVLFMKRMSDEANLCELDSAKTSLIPSTISENVIVYEFIGPLFFAVASKLNSIKITENTKCVILRMRAVPSIDTDAIKILTEFITKCKNDNISVIISHPNAQPIKAMNKSGITTLTGEENICSSFDLSIKRAEQICL